MKVKTLILILILALGISFSYDFVSQKVHAASSSKTDYSFLPDGATKSYLRNDVYKYYYRGAYGLCDKYGIIVRANYESIEELDDNTLLVKYRGLSGLMDYNGRLLVYPQWESVSKAETGYYYVRKNGLEGIIDIYGNYLVPVAWESVLMVSTKEFCVKQNSLWGVIDSKQSIIVPIEWDYIKTIGDYYKVERDGLYGVVYAGGKVLFEPKYSYLNMITKNELISLCNTTTGCGVMTMDKKVYFPLEYEGIFGILNNYNFMFSLNERSGVIDFMGKKIAEPIYDSFSNIDEHVAFTKKGKKLGIISLHEKNEIVPPIYDKIEKTDYKGFYKIKQDGDWGVVGFDGEMIFQCDNGPFEINRKLKKYTKLEKYADVFEHNLYHNKLRLAYFYLKAYSSENASAKRCLREILNSGSKNNDLKIEAQKLVDKYKVNLNY